MKKVKKVLCGVLLVSIFAMCFTFTSILVFANDSVIVTHTNTGGATESGAFTSGPTAWTGSSLPNATAVGQGKPYDGAVAGSKSSGGTDAWARFTPKAGMLETGAAYMVYYANINRTELGYSGDSSLATIKVAHSSGTSTIAHSQRDNLNTWVLLGQYSFLGDGTEYVEIVKNSESGTYLHAHSVKFEKVIVAENDATLAGLSFSAGSLTPDFSPATTAYSFNTSESTTTITATPANSGSTIEINGAPVTNGVATDPYLLALGTTNITIQVTAPDGITVQTYTVDVAKTETIISTSDALNYSEPVGSWGGSSTVKGYDGVIGTRYSGGTNSTAQFKTTISQPGVYNIQFYKSVWSTNSSNILAEVVHDGITTQTTLDLKRGSSGWVDLGTYYFIGDESEVVRAIKTETNSENIRTSAIRVTPSAFTGAESDLTALNLNYGSLSQAFSSSQTTYTADVGLFVNNIRVTPFALNSAAAITVNGQSVVSGNESADISLNNPSTMITIVVTSPNGVNETTYTLTVNKTSNIILDYGDAGYSEEGGWADSSTYKGQGNSSSRYIGGEPDSTAGEPSITYSTALQSAQSLTVKVYKIVAADNNDPNVKWQVHHNGITENFYLDYSQGTSGWVTLGVFDFAGIGDEYVKLTRIAPMTDDSIITRADAVMFETVPNDQVIFGTPVFLDNTQQALYDIQTGMITAKIAIDNPTVQDYDVSFVVALYDTNNGETTMVDLAIAEPTNVLAETTGEFTVTLEVPSGLTNPVIKTFLWKDMQSIVPRTTINIFE